VRIVYLWLIALTIGGMVLHNLLDFLFKIRRRLREHLGLVVHAAGHAAASAEDAVAEGGRWFVRMTVSERLQHGLLAVSFGALVFTGFALKFPETWIFSWLARLEGGYAWRSLIHRGAALVMVTTALFHVVYLVGARGRRFLLDMLPTLADAQQAIHNLTYWLGLSRTPPRFERFGYIEKAEYWALIWGTGVMTVTGGLLWFENQSLQVVDKWVLDLATLVHYYEAWLAFLAIVVWHLYQNVANPDVYPMNWSWITGRIGEEQLRHEHRAEWERLLASEAEEEASEEEPDSPPDDEPNADPNPNPA
jgi:cytochrome b subunit of formate dehydrogenase